MRILLINQVFYPDVAATAQHAHDLARHLVAHGHHVDVIACRAIYGQKGAPLPKRETVDGIEIHRVGRSLFGKATIALRIVDFALVYVAFFLKALFIRRPDVVVCLTTPPFIALLGVLLRAVRGSRFVYWVMDLYPDLPVACGVMKPASLPTRFFEALNRFCLRRADRIVVLGRCMRDRVLAKGVNPARAEHIGVWSPEEPGNRIDHAANPYRAEWGLDGRLAVMYSGNFGIGHDVETMCAAAEALASDDRFRFVFVGGGKRKEEVDAFVRARNLANCILAPYQPREKLEHSLSAADVHLASLKEGVEGIMVPCKLFGAMAAARPTIFIGNPASELARVLEEHEAGLCVRCGDVDALVAALKRFADDEPLRRRMGDNARRALADAYGRDKACEHWRELLEATVTGAAAAAPGAAARSEGQGVPAAPEPAEAAR